MNQKTTLGVFLSCHLVFVVAVLFVFFYLFVSLFVFFRQDLQLAWSLSSRLGWPTKEPQGTSCFSTISTRITSVYHHTWLSSYAFWGLNSSPHETIVFPSEISIPSAHRCYLCNYQIFLLKTPRLILILYDFRKTLWSLSPAHANLTTSPRQSDNQPMPIWYSAHANLTASPCLMPIWQAVYVNLKSSPCQLCPFCKVIGKHTTDTSVLLPGRTGRRWE